MWATTYLRMEAKAVRVDTQLWGGRHGSAWQALQAQHFLPSAWAQRNTISARGGLQRPQGAIGIRFGEVAPLWDATPASYSWSVTAGDTTPPDTTITSSPALVSKQSTALFKFISTEPGSTFACKLDLSPTFTPCTSPQNYNHLGIGPHTFQVYAIDAAGNKDPTPATFIWTVQ